MYVVLHILGTLHKNTKYGTVLDGYLIDYGVRI